MTIITATLKDINGKLLSKQIVQITVNKKTYMATTNSKGVATFKIKKINAGKFTINGKYKGKGNFDSSSSKNSHVVKGIADLKITKIKKVGSKYKIVVKNQGSLSSVKTKLKIFFGKSTKTYNVKRAGKSKFLIITLKLSKKVAKSLNYYH